MRPASFAFKPPRATHGRIFPFQGILRAQGPDLANDRCLNMTQEREKQNILRDFSQRSLDTCPHLYLDFLLF
jgi:hypothetical protein